MKEQIENAKKLCLERDAGHCRHCGTMEGLEVFQLHQREGRLAWQLSNLITLCDECKKEADKARLNKGNNKVGVMLCGGRGTRLAPMTLHINKHILPIALTPMMFYPLKTLRSLGVHRVLVVVDRDGANQIIPMLGSGKEFGMDISYKVQEGAGGLSEALYLAKDFTKPGDEIICILGDNLFDNSNFSSNINLKYDEVGNPKYKSYVFVKRVSNPEDYGVAVIENNKVKKIVEKPKEYISDMAVLGLYIYTYDVFSVIESVSPSERGELEISSVNDYYASKKELGYQVVKNYWADCGGSIQKYAEASMHGAKQAKVSIKDMINFMSVVFDEK